MLNMNFFLLIFIACLAVVYYGNSISQELGSGDLITQEPESGDLITQEPESGDLITQKPESGNSIAKAPERECPITNNSAILASVREYPSFLHKCMATFISPSILLTVASCVLCAEECEFFVQLFRDHLEDHDSDVYKISTVTFEPNFDTNPEELGIALIRLEKPVPQAPVFSLPDYYDNPLNILSNIYSWRFTADKQDFRLVTNCVVTISNYQCALWKAGYVPSTALCVYGNELLTLGPFDLGSPVIGKLEIRDEKIMAEVILGIFNGPRMVRETHVMLYKSVFPLLPWIGSFLDEARQERLEMRMEIFKE